MYLNIHFDNSQNILHNILQCNCPNNLRDRTCSQHCTPRCKMYSLRYNIRYKYLCIIPCNYTLSIP